MEYQSVKKFVFNELWFTIKPWLLEVGIKNVLELKIATGMKDWLFIFCSKQLIDYEHVKALDELIHFTSSQKQIIYILIEEIYGLDISKIEDASKMEEEHYLGR